MAARNRVVGAGGGESNGTTQGANGQAVAVFQGIAQLAGTIVEDSITIVPNYTFLTWTKIDYV